MNTARGGRRRRRAIAMNGDWGDPRFWEAVEVIRTRVGERYRCDPVAAVHADAHALTIRGLLTRERQADTWWLYVVDATRLQEPSGPEAVALEFSEQYDAERGLFR